MASPLLVSLCSLSFALPLRCNTVTDLSELLSLYNPRVYSFPLSYRFVATQWNAGYEFVLWAVESFGRLQKEAARLLNDLGDVAAADGCASKDTFARTVRQEFSCALCKGNARMYDRSIISVARAVGRGFSPGLDRAIDEAGNV